MRIADLSLEFLARHQRRDRVDHDHIDRVALDEHLSDLHRLFTTARLAHEQRMELHTELLAPARVKRMLRIDDRRDTARLLCLGAHVQGNGGLTARLRAKDLDDPPAWQADPTEGQVHRKRARTDPLDLQLRLAPQRHDRSLAKLLFNLLQCGLQVRFLFQDALQASYRLDRCFVFLFNPRTFS